MKVYLSGKISGVEDLNRPKFERAEKELNAKGYDVVNPHKLFPAEPIRAWDEYMKNDIKHMMDCDMVAVLDDWKDSPGACIEVNLAFCLRMKVVSADTFEPIQLKNNRVIFNL